MSQTGRGDCLRHHVEPARPLPRQATKEPRVSFDKHLRQDSLHIKIESFPVTRFLLELTQHIPPVDLRYIRRYGLYAPQRRWYGTPAARTKGKWPDMPGGAQPVATGA